MRPNSDRDSRFDKQALLAADEHQFSTLMVEVNELLQEKGVQIFARSIHAIPVVCAKGGISLLGLVDPLSKRIVAWFNAYYGERMNADMSRGYGPVVIRGDLYKMCSPWLVAGEEIVCTPSKVEPFGAVRTTNVLDFIDGLTNQQANDLTTSELEALKQTFIQRLTQFEDIRHLQNDAAFEIAQGNLKGVVDLLCQDRPQRAEARWACLQAVEKFLKQWIHRQGGSYSWNHKLAQLNDRAHDLGLPRVSDIDLATVQCEPGVRYGEIPVSTEEVVAAFDAALRCCAFIAKEIKKSDIVSQPKVERPEANCLTRKEFLALRAGDKLWSGGTQLTIIGIAREEPRWYRTLVRGAIQETTIIEDDFQSFAFVEPLVDPLTRSWCRVPRRRMR